MTEDGAVAPLPFDFVTDPPFSFTLDGVPSAALLPTWSPTSTEDAVDGGRSRQTVVWTGPDGLRVTCVAVRYADHPVVEWTVWFANTGTVDSGRLGAVLAIDTTIGDGDSPEWTVHTNSGSLALPTDFRPAALSLNAAPDRRLLFSTEGGRPTSGSLAAEGHPAVGAWPYYNLDRGDAGAVVALAWPGQWGLQLDLDQTGRIALTGGMTNRDEGFTPTSTLPDLALTDTYLTPGETIRTPLIVTMAWRGGDWVDAQNRWRAWFVRHNTPQPGGQPPAPMCPTGSVCCSFNYTQETTAADLDYLDHYHRQGLTPAAGGHLDWWWIDAGWYTIPASIDPADHMAWTYTGDWTVDRDRYPRGLVEITDRARAEGMRAIIWHEPERTRPGTWVHEQHPEWLLAAADPEHRYLDLGLPAVREWLISTFDGLITSNGADLFRQDFNYHGPLPHWNRTDRPGRRGTTQIHYVVGLLAFWDALRARHPDMLIDNCASGGRRLDLESLRRCVAMSHSDNVKDPEGAQGQHLGLSSWVVCHGTSARIESMYGLRSAMDWLFEMHVEHIGPDGPDDAQWELLRRASAEWAGFADCYLGEFYPLTPHSEASDAWIAYQHQRPDASSGVVHVFARADAGPAARTVRPRGLTPTVTYEVVDTDRPEDGCQRTGADLMSAGVEVTPADLPQATTVVYRQVDG